MLNNIIAIQPVNNFVIGVRMKTTNRLGWMKTKRKPLSDADRAFFMPTQINNNKVIDRSISGDIINTSRQNNAACQAKQRPRVARG